MPPLTPRDLQSAKEVEKLELEIASLQKKTRWENLTQFLPVLPVAVAVLGFFFTVYVFGIQQASDQEKTRTSRELERRTALQGQIRTETDEILRFTGDPKLTVSRVAFLLADIQTILDSPINKTALDPADKEINTLADVLPKYKDSLTRSLVILVRDDCDFSRHSRDVELADAVVYYWDDYSNYLAKDSEDFHKLNYILWEYTKALQNLHDQNPGYLESFHLEEDGLEPSPKYAKQKNDDLLYDHLINITDGFRKHLQILCRENLGEKAGNLRKTRLEEFRTSFSNPVVSNYLLEREINDASCGHVR